MKLIIGGYAQGKLRYVLQRYALDKTMVLDGTVPGDETPRDKTVIVNHFHNWVRACILQGDCPEEAIRMVLERHPDCIIISNEIGSGIVPADASDREYRERTGRILVELADRAEEVERVICGIGQRIK